MWFSPGSGGMTFGRSSDTATIVGGRGVVRQGAARVSSRR
ncbi:Uncharacterised protein [Amycolatopsis camponoti]|uniref:Uncharacterized protein n=1 Tax=Amycolatopsis camponoti TaxID=2606593 RepID=A0A6I8LP53_9PSEU|nr:Uncharacterised protein [Amycolatopsis camponoti]